MRIIKPDPVKAAIDKAKKEGEAKLAEQRKDYLDSLRKNGKFKRFVVEDILKKNLDFLTDLRNIKGSNMEEMGKLVFQAQSARIMLEKILGELLNG